MEPSSGLLSRPAALPGAPPKGLTGRDLEGFLQAALSDWVGLSAEHFADREDGGADLPLERMLRFEDPFPGVWVIRSIPDLGSILEAKTSTMDLDLLTLLLVRVWREMVRGAYALDLKEVRPCRYKASRPSDWPSREPDWTSLSLVGRCPVEMRLWMGETAGR